MNFVDTSLGNFCSKKSCLIYFTRLQIFIQRFGIAKKRLAILINFNCINLSLDSCREGKRGRKKCLMIWLRFLLAAHDYL